MTISARTPMLIVTTAILIGCSQPRPSATEIFNLRHRCTESAKRYTKSDYQQDVEYSSPYYNVEDNRCYVAERDASFDDSKKTVNPFVSIFLIDVETGESVAHLTKYDDGNEKAEIEGRYVGYKQAEARINKLLGQKPF
jgi:hypothetical protein